MKRALIAALFLLTACDSMFPKTVYGEAKREDAVVEDIIFSPRRHGSDVAVGITGGGNISVAPVDITLPEKKTIVLRCPHGRFTFESDRGTQNGAWAEDLFQKSYKGQTLTLEYREMFLKRGDKPLEFVKYVTVAIWRHE